MNTLYTLTLAAADLAWLALVVWWLA